MEGEMMMAEAEGQAEAGAEELVVFPYQQDHINRMVEVLSRSAFALDLSMLGTGKTYATTKMAMHHLRMKHMVIVSPVSVKAKWQHMKATYGAPISSCLSFCETKSRRFKQPKHGLLIRRDYEEVARVERNGNKIMRERVDFSPTQLYADMVREGTLLVLDEIQNVKNMSVQHTACAALMKEIVDSGGRSRVVLLSGSPIDKQQQVVTLFHFLGILPPGRQLCEFSEGFGRGFVPTGILDVETFCKELEPSSKVYQGRKRCRDERSCNQYAYELFQGVFKGKLAHSMQPPVLQQTLVKRNGFFHIESEADMQLLTKGVEMLSRVCGFNHQNQTINFGGRSGAEVMRTISLALQQIETAKTATLARLARKSLLSSPGRKVALCVNYCATVTDLSRLLADFDPLVVNGALGCKRRAERIEQFQAPDSSRRLIICNVTVCSSGIDLDDKHGGFPRDVYISPMYNTITLYQLCHRFLRMDTRSSSNIYMVYGVGAVEQRVLDALGLKSRVMKETTEDQVAAGIQFPGDYPDYLEGR
jgi:hypothetical protein